MNKPTLFFSHSSKDKDMIVAIKDKIVKYTGNTLDIFVSSDGESIPFGRNWIHKIEDGLKNAKIMFVFVTENSISTGWIYFEAGFAYSQGIQVIPVGIGINIGALKAPLNLLQGFNITSFESFNNFISIINKSFEYDFSECFTDRDYIEIMELAGFASLSVPMFHEVICSIKSELYSEYRTPDSKVITNDLCSFFDKIISYLEEKEISLAVKNLQGQGAKELSVKGIIIAYLPDSTSTQQNSQKTTMKIKISPYNFEKSFSLYLNLLSLFDEDSLFYIHIRLNKLYSYVTEDVDTAAILAEYPEWFSFSDKGIGYYGCDRLNCEFKIYNHSFSYREPDDFILNIVFDCEKIISKDITTLVSKLIDLGIIYKES